MQFLSILVLVGAATAVNIPIAVGQNGSLTFTPNLISAAVGDTLVFTFQSSIQHAVAQASLNAPCQPASGSFYSGDITAPPTSTFSVDVMTSDPIYFYCPVHRHCQSGMVGIVNSPNGNLTLASYIGASKNVTNNTAPSSTAGTGGIVSNSSGQSNSTTSAAATSTSVPIATITSTVVKSSATATTTSSASASAGYISGAKIIRGEMGRAGIVDLAMGAFMAVAGLL